MAEAVCVLNRQRDTFGESLQQSEVGVFKTFSTARVDRLDHSEAPFI
ncbi:MAG: hypothetical protein ACREQN_06665 [Candidatus Binataceae bacterium]